MILPQVSATSSDGPITYSIETGSTPDLSLDPNTGLLETTKPLDRETIAQYIITVKAEDQMGRTSYSQVCLLLITNTNYLRLYVQVIVTVGDENEAPTFPLNSYTYRIDESSPITTTLNPSAIATDADVGDSGQFEYFLQPSTGHPLHVDHSTGAVSLQGELDRETMPSYTLTLQAVDQDFFSRTGTTELRSVCH